MLVAPTKENQCEYGRACNKDKPGPPGERRRVYLKTLRQWAKPGSKVETLQRGGAASCTFNLNAHKRLPTPMRFFAGRYAHGEFCDATTKLHSPSSAHHIAKEVAYCPASFHELINDELHVPAHGQPYYAARVANAISLTRNPLT